MTEAGVERIDHGSTRARLDRLRAFLAAARLPGAIICTPPHLRYLTGWAGRSPAFLIVTPDGGTLVAPGGAVGDALCGPLGLALEPYVGYEAGALVDQVAAACAEVARAAVRLGLTRRSAGRLGAEPAALPAAVVAAIGSPRLVDLTPELLRWRRFKDADEIVAIRRSVAALDAAFAAIAAAIRPGATERHLFLSAHDALVDRAVEPFLLDCNVSSGRRTTESDPHATGRRLGRGDLVLVDLYPVLDGYVADTCRVFTVGPAAPDQRERHAVLEASLEAGARELRPAVAVADIDRAVRRILAEAGGYDRTMAHHTGHGIGLAAWEEPWIGPRLRPDGGAVLVEGDVVAIEPGLYLEGWGGMRLEGNYLVTAGGAERLDRYPSALVEAG